MSDNHRNKGSEDERPDGRPELCRLPLVILSRGKGAAEVVGVDADHRTASARFMARSYTAMISPWVVSAVSL